MLRAKRAVILVNYNTKDVLIDCLKNLLEQNPQNTKVIIVDNGSKDGSAEMVATEFPSSRYPQVELIKTQNNGLACGYNLAMAHAKNADYYLFMGTDAFPKPGCLDGVMDFLEKNPQTGVATAKLTLRTGKLDMDAHRGFPTPWTALTHFSGLDRLFPKSRIFNRYFMGWSDMEKPHEIDLCISHFMMVKRQVFDKIGRWDEDFFVYGEDVDLCWRVKQAGFKIYYLPQFECLHFKGVGVGIRKESLDVTKADEATRKRMRAETTRAMRLFYQKHMYKKYPWLVNKSIELGIQLLAHLRQM